MAGCQFKIGDSVGFIDFPDAYGETKVGNRIYRWDFHEYCGPLFLRKDGEPLKVQPGEKNKVWPKFDRWLKRYYKKRPKTP